MKNIIKFFLTKEEIEQLIYHITQIENILRGKLVALDAKDRNFYGLVKEFNKLLINKVFQQRQSMPSLSSPDIDWEEFTRDYEARQFYESFLFRLNSLSYDIESTKMLHDYDNYRDALTEYAFAKYKKTNDDGFELKADDLRQFFNRTGKKNKNKTKKD